MKRRSFDREFKMSAVKMILDENIPVTRVAEELSIHRNTLYLWLREYESFGENAFPGHGNEIRNYQFEIRRLEKENRALMEELDILKKYQAFLKQKNR